MKAKIFPRLRSRGVISTVNLLLLCGAECAFAQTQPAPPSQKQPATAVIQYDPTRPEIQPNLSIDRDPIPSPDPEENMALKPAVPAGANQPGGVQRGQGGIYTLEENVNEVLLNCTVVDDKGRLVRDLNAKNFRVWEDGAAQSIASFQHRDLPVSMGILVDNSGSMLDKRAAATAAALALVRASNPQDSAFIVNFSDRAYLDQGFTSNISSLERGLSRFDARGTTALYDAVAASADELAGHAKQPKQALLIITDGADNASRLSLEQAIRRVQNLGGPVVYSMGLLFDDEKGEAQAARKALEMLSQETGGIAYFPQSLQDVSAIAAQVAEDIRNQYILGYHSNDANNLRSYRTVRVEATAPNHGKLTVRTRRGYFPKTGQKTGQNQQTAQTTQ